MCIRDRTEAGATWVWMDDKPTTKGDQADMCQATGPISTGAMASGMPMDDDAWMSLPSEGATAAKGCTDRPWPAWKVVAEQGDDGIEAGARTWTPQPVEPSENLAGWHTCLLPRQARLGPPLECAGDGAAWTPGPPNHYR
eukprot:10015-Prorocentrum_lima.AAC.1